MRVIYYHVNAKSHIHLLTLYRKSEVLDLSCDQINMLRKLVKQIEKS